MQGSLADWGGGDPIRRQRPGLELKTHGGFGRHWGWVLTCHSPLNREPQLNRPWSPLGFHFRLARLKRSHYHWVKIWKSSFSIFIHRGGSQSQMDKLGPLATKWLWLDFNMGLRDVTRLFARGALTLFRPQSNDFGVRSFHVKTHGNWHLQRTPRTVCT